MGSNELTEPARAERPSIAVVVPCYNEAASLPALLDRLEALLAAQASTWQILLVDDGSRDDSRALYARWRDRPGLRVLELSRNFGKEAALSAGIDAADADVVVLMDADGQHAPELVPEFLRRWRQGADMVVTVRAHRQDENWIKRAGTALFYRLMHTGQRFEVPPGAGDFRLMDRAVVQALRALPERTRFMKGLYAWVGFDVALVPYEPAQRLQGRSSFNLRRLLSLSMAGLTSFTTWPLRMVSVLGTLIALLAIAYGLYISIEYLLWGNEVSGWSTIVVGMALLSGVQLISLGVLGEYVARVFDEVKGRPLYVVARDSAAAPVPVPMPRLESRLGRPFGDRPRTAADEGQA